MTKTSLRTLLLLLLAVALPLAGQSLHRNTPGQLRFATDLGPAPASQPLHRMLLLLKRSPTQQAALDQLVADQQTASAPQYHQWLTPAQFGAQFGPSDADLATVTSWLTSQGFSVDHISAGRTVIEFSGTVGTVSTAFQTSIHKVAVNSVEHWSNTSDPVIPAALSSTVAGVVSLNNFLKPAGHLLGQGHGQLSTPEHPEPALNYTDNNGNPQHAIVPGDFATIYNVAPLYTAGINGSGETIAIVARSDISATDVQQFRQLFVPSGTGTFKMIENGPDPGGTGSGSGDEMEAALDTEWAGGVAPDANIDLVVSASTDTTDGVDLSGEYIVDNDLAPVMNTSFSACEAGLGSNENAFIESLYEQAVAEGITVVDSAGDSGAAACDPNDGSEAAATQGIAVSGLASTPYDTGVGGTEFNEGSGSYWAASNNSTTHASALSYIPETTWNESCADGKSDCQSSGPLSATGGGKSSAGTVDSNGNPIPYPKPSWQSAPGVPNDSVRDVPDVAFSAAGHDGYVVCVDGACATQNGSFGFYVFSGTSASAPSFSAVMALINQKTGSTQGQGLANYNLYALARSSKQNYSACNSATASASAMASCIFNDITTGNNNVPCVGGTPNCSGSGTQTMTGYSAGAGYDLVTGLGSINVANLVNNWSSVTPTLGTSTTLSISPSSNVAHGAQVTVSITVTPSTGGTLGPSGDAVLLAQPASGGAYTAIDAYNLSPGGCTNNSTALAFCGYEYALPGGSYNVVARYSGDANFAPSYSSPVAVTVTPEGSITGLGNGLYTVNSQGQEISVNGSSVPYGTADYLEAFVEGATQAAANNSNANIFAGIPTGSVTFENNGTALTNSAAMPNPLTLNSEGEAYYPNGASFLPPASYSITANYGGDASFSGSASGAITFTITQAPTNTTVASAASGGATTLTATVATTSYGAAPTGTVTFYSGTTVLGSPVQVTGGADSSTGTVNATAVLTGVTATGSFSASYSGDTNYSGSVPFSITPTSETASVAAGSSTTYSLTLGAVNGFSGSVALSCTGAPTAATCTVSPTSVTISGSATQTATVTVATTAASLAPPLNLPSGPWTPTAPWRWLMLGAAAALLALAVRLRRLRLAVVIGFAALAVACGGGGSSGGSTTTAPYTPAGTYTLEVVGTSGTGSSQTTSAIPLTLTVTN